MNDVETLIVVVVIVAYSIGRQLAGEPLRAKRLVGLPLVLTIIGIIDVAKGDGAGPTSMDIALIAAGCAVNAGIGMWQGRLMRLESRHGSLWGQMPRSVLWGWGFKIASGIVLDGIAHALGAYLATISAVMLLELGVNRLAQGATVAVRGLCTGIPFAPESTTPHAAHSKSLPGKPITTSTGDASARPTNAAFNLDRVPRHPTGIPTSLSRYLRQPIAPDTNDVNDAVR